MGFYVLKRLGVMAVIVFAVASLVFIMMKLAPGDPALQQLGPHASVEALAALRHEWGLDRPVFEQYVDFIRGLFSGNLGDSLTYREPISDLIADRLPRSLLLLGLGALFAIAFALPLAVWVTTSKSPIASFVVRVVAAALHGMPSFFVSALLIQFLALKAHLFPVAGFGDTPLEALHSAILPGIAIGLSIFPVLVRSLSQSLGTSLQSEYVKFGTAKGLSERRVTFNYALRNGSISGISILGIQVGFLVGGTLVVENVFAIPGLGRLLLGAVLARDFPVVQACAVVFGVIVVGVYLLTDLAYAAMDPRARPKKALA